MKYRKQNFLVRFVFLNYARNLNSFLSYCILNTMLYQPAWYFLPMMDIYMNSFNIFTFHWKIDELIGGFRIALSVICKLKVYVLKRDKWFGGFTKQPWFNLVVSRCNLQLSLSSINCMQQKHPINELFSLNLNIYFYVQEKQELKYRKPEWIKMF